MMKNTTTTSLPASVLAIAMTGKLDTAPGKLGTEMVNMAYRKNHNNASCLRVLPILLTVQLLLSVTGCRAGTYEQRKSIHDTLLDSSRYSPLERPLRNQEDILYVAYAFELVSILEVNDVVQSFMCNGFLALIWEDQMLTWNASNYGGEAYITPKVTSVFRPLMVLLNTMGDRDLFADDHAPLTVYAQGLVTWSPGSIFPASCKLDLTKFPYDDQYCEIHMVIMNYDVTELQFIAGEPTVGFTFFTRNGLWEITNSSQFTPTITVRGKEMPSIKVSFNLKRKPTFLVISILLPTVFLSLLNLLVFVIPVDSGEKISYGITVLLALTVFLSILSGMLPRSSESMPLVIYYIFILLTISVLTVVDSVIIVRLHHMEEKVEKSQNARANFKSAMSKISHLRGVIAPLTESRSSSELYQRPTLNDNNSTSSINVDLSPDMKRSRRSPIWNLGSSKETPKINKYKIIGKYIDNVSLIVFGVIWVSVTVGFSAAVIS